MAVAGTLDRHPRLRLIVGHMGEMLPMMMARIDQVFKHDIGHLKRPITRAILDQVWLTTSGNGARDRPLQMADVVRSEEHTSELQSHLNLVCRLLLEKKKKHATAAL